MKLQIQKFTFNPFQENTYVLHNGTSCVIFDPGCQTKEESQQLFDFIDNNNLKPLALLLTHSHIDHVLGCNAVLTKYDIDFYCHKIDIETLNAVPTYAHVYGFPDYTPPKPPNKLLEGGELLNFDGMELKVIFAPGHAPGHVVYYNEENTFVVNGDVLFAGSYGRVDLPGGSMEVLKDTILNTMFKLPENTIVLCGHGDETTIGQEKKTNYILQA